MGVITEWADFEGVVSMLGLPWSAPRVGLFGEKVQLQEDFMPVLVLTRSTAAPTKLF